MLPPLDIDRRDLPNSRIPILLRQCITGLLAIFLTLPCLAKETESLNIVISFLAAEGDAGWQAKALEDSSQKFISGFQRLQIVEANQEFQHCQSFGCQISALHRAGVSYLWQGVLDNKSLKYQVVEVPSRAILNSGYLELGRSAVDSQVQALQAIRPLVRMGGIVDQVLTKRQTNLWSLPETLKPFDASGYHGGLSAVLALIGGFAWGYLLLVTGRFIFGTFHGVETIWHWNLFQLLHSWFEVLFAKLFLILAALTPSLGLSLTLVYKFNFSAQPVWFLVFPLIALIQMALYVLLSTFFSLLLDKKKVAGKISRNQVWDYEIRRYLMGYYRRLGLDIPLSILERIRFLPGSTPDVLTYGGVFVRPRVVIPFKLLEFAIGEPEIATQEKLDRAPLAANECLGLVLPKHLNNGITAKASEKKIEKRVSRSKFYITPKHAMLYVQNYTHPPMEASAGVWGYIRPQRGDDDSVPLVADSLEDLKIVEQLLTEHHVNFARFQFEEEYDDTDPTDLDFLFGLLLREIGRVHRREHYFLAWWHLVHRILDFYKNHFSKHPAFVADAYVVLQHGRHHLAQYIYYWASGETDLLTQRGNRQQLQKVSKQIFSKFQRISRSKEDLHRNRATPFNRMIWLSQFFSAGVPDYPYKKGKPIVPALMGLLALLVIGFEFTKAYEYRPVYEQRMTDVKEQIKEYYKEKEKSDGSGR